MSTLFTSNAYLDELSAKVRVKPVPWEGYRRVGIMTADELLMIKKIDRQPKATVESVLLCEGQAYVLLFMNLLKRVQRNDATQLLLVLIADALTDREERIPLFFQITESDPELPYTPLVRCLESPDEFSKLKAAQLLAILSNHPKGRALPNPDYHRFLKTLSLLTQQSSSAEECDISIQIVESLMLRPENRQAVWETPAFISGFMNILRHNPGPQMSYQIVFCLWLLSFEQNIAAQINKDFDVISVLVSVAQTAQKEKVTRVIAATFRNLVTKAPAENLPDMLVCQLLPFLKKLLARKWTDDDILEDIRFLITELTTRFESLTTYDEYVSELLSGHLSWTPAHDSENFWKENAQKLTHNDCNHLKMLLHLLKESTDPKILAVAAHDVGQFAKYYDRGKIFLTELGGKARVMDLMTHPDSSVRYQSLLSVQQLVSQPWNTV